MQQLQQLIHPRAPHARRAALRVGSATSLLSALALLATSARPLAAQAPGTSNGFASAYPNGIFGNTSCFQSYSAQPTGTASCNMVSSTVSATGTTSSTNATRTVLAQSGGSTVNTAGTPFSQTGSTQYGQVTVSGTAGSPNSLVYHFGTTSSLSLTGATSQYSSAYWDLWLQSTQQGTNTQAVVINELLGNGTSITNGTSSSRLQPNASNTGYDFTAPFDASGGLVTYYFNPRASTGIDQDMNASSWASIMITLMSIDAVDAQGQTVGTVTFGTDGNGTLVLGNPSTVPEPSELALLATGLLGLVPVARRPKQ